MGSRVQDGYFGWLGHQMLAQFGAQKNKGRAMV